MGSSPFLIFIFSFIAILGSLHSVVMIGIEVYRIYDRSIMAKHLSSEIYNLEKELAGLNAIIENKDDQIYLEQLARCTGYAYPNEIRYITKGVNSSNLKLNCQ